MKWFHHLQGGKKLLIALLAICALSAIGVLAGIKHMSAMNESANDMYQRELLGLARIKAANASLLSLARAQKNIITARTEEQRQKYVDEADKAETEFQENLKAARPLFWSEKGKEDLAKTERAWEECKKVRKQVLEAALQTKPEDGKGSTGLSAGDGEGKNQP